MAKRTMWQLSYGIARPGDLFEKLSIDAAKLTATPHPHDVFNFFVTAAVLNDWVSQIYSDHPIVSGISDAMKKRSFDVLPVEPGAWIVDKSCLPNLHCDIRRHIFNALRICWDTANASKHYHWVAKSEVKAIEPNPIVGDWYQYFFTSVAPDLYIDYGGEVYGLAQLRGIILQFYAGLLAHLRTEDAPPDA